jgi:hypothetical protein
VGGHGSYSHDTGLKSHFANDVVLVMWLPVTSRIENPLEYFIILGCGGSPHTSTNHFDSDVLFLLHLWSDLPCDCQ